MTAADCLFCKIVSGEVPSTTVYEGDAVVAFRDISPAAPTHVLVIPKQHVRDVRDIGAEHGPMLVELFDAADRVARAEKLEGGYRLVLNVGADAGQTVFHLHLHVLGGAPLGLMARPQ